MVELKTKLTGKSVEAFLDAIENQKKRDDSRVILDLMRDATCEEPKMWGDSIVGFGSYRYKYASGREGDWFLTGFSPRKGNLTLYIMDGFSSYGKLLKKLGKHKTGKACLYIKRLEDIDLEVLERMINASVERKSRPGTTSGC